jgi:outer membrane protein insertion porin family
MENLFMNRLLAFSIAICPLPPLVFGWGMPLAIAAPVDSTNTTLLLEMGDRAGLMLVSSVAESLPLMTVGDRTGTAMIDRSTTPQPSQANLLQPSPQSKPTPLIQDSSVTLAATVTETSLTCPHSPPLVMGTPSSAIVSAIGIRFRDGAGKVTDEAGNLRQGRTPVDYICRNLRVRVGDVFQDDRARQDLRYLYGLGIFDRVTFITEPDGQGGLRLLYQVQEGATNSFSLAGGSDEVSGYYAGFGYRQQLGIATQAQASIQYGTRGHLQLSGSVFTPPLGDGTPGYRVYGFNRYTLSTVFDDTILLSNGDKVHINRLSTGASVLNWFGDWQGELGIAFNAISTRDASNRIFATDVQGNPLSFSGTGLDDLLTLNASLTIDQRDNPSDPVYGGILKLSSEQSIPLARGNILGNRLLANYTYYWALSDPRPDRLQETLAFNVQVGTVIGDLPPYLAFVAGGPESVRGYDFGAIGSGRSFFLTSVEYRFPVTELTVFEQAIPIGGVLFTDFASDLGSGRAVLGEPGVIRGKPGSGFGYGVGLRALSPFGLLRTDVGISDRGEVRVNFSFGQRF